MQGKDGGEDLHGGGFAHGERICSVADALRGFALRRIDGRVCAEVDAW